jgi:hypothetical protein
VHARERAKRGNGEVGSAEKDEPQVSAGLYEVVGCQLSVVNLALRQS